MHGDRTNAWLAAARADTAGRVPDQMVETQLLARVRERQALASVASARPARRAERGRTESSWWTRLTFAVPVALAGMVAVIVGVPLLAPTPAVPARKVVATPFIALVGSEALARESAPMVVPSQVARTALADYGLPVDPARADEPIDAEFLVSRSGLVLAVRFKE